MAKRRNACVPRPGKDGKTYWHKVGSAFDFDKGTVVFFDSLPMPDKEGKTAVHLFEIEEKDSQGAERAGVGNETTPAARNSRDHGSRATLDDDIPFAPEFR